MHSQKRDEILAAALTAVSQYGFHGASMSMIAETTKCGIGTIYNYFASKDDLMRALFVKIKQEFVIHITADIQPGMDLEFQFLTMWRNMVRYYIQYPDRVAFAQQFHYSPYFDQETMEYLNTIMVPIIAPFELGMAGGRIKSIPLPVLESLTLEVAGSLARKHMTGEIQLDDELISQTGQICWAAIREEGNPEMRSHD